MAFPYPTDKDIIRDNLFGEYNNGYHDGYTKGYRSGYDLGRDTIINDINAIIKTSDDAFILLLALSNLLHKETHKEEHHD